MLNLLKLNPWHRRSPTARSQRAAGRPTRIRAAGGHGSRGDGQVPRGRVIYSLTVDGDLELLDRWRAGDRRAGNQLFQRHFDSIWRFFQNKIQGDVDELVQITFLACVRGRDQFRKECSFRTFLFTIARRELYRYLRKRHRDRNALDFGVTSLADLNTTPRSKLAKRDEHKLLLRALRMMPIELQVLLELHYWEGMGTSELADIFEVKPGAMRTRLSRARKQLRETMDKMADKPLTLQTSVANLDAWAAGLRKEMHKSER